MINPKDLICNKNEAKAFILRHSDRYDFTPGTIGSDVLLNEKGKENAIYFGSQLKHSEIKNIFTSSVKRCVQTAEYIREGYGTHFEIIEAPELGNPGTFVQDPEKTGKHYLKHGIYQMYQDLIRDIKIDGMRTAKEGADILRKFIIENTHDSGLTLFISHDSLIILLQFVLEGKVYTQENWLGFLEGFEIKK